MVTLSTALIYCLSFKYNYFAAKCLVVYLFMGHTHRYIYIYIYIVDVYIDDLSVRGYGNVDIGKNGKYKLERPCIQ